jgi:DNA segregation ATPase FtsK/SpoIIIE, S-DNA-T family
MNENNLLSQWINRILVEHFRTEKAQSTEKLFIKISGLNIDNYKSLLDILNEGEAELNQYYNPIIRTITKIDGYESFAYQDHETSTWLRNNTKLNHALILLINESTPEAQSLENLFTIDESYILSPIGMEALFGLLSEKGLIVTDEIKDFKIFFEMYNAISEPQLRNILKFMVSILNDQDPSIIQKMKRYLPAVHLFVDTKLPIKKASISRLRKNFQLANLQNGPRNLDPEKLLNNLYAFLEKEEQNSWEHEVWQEVNPESFRKHAIDFINRISEDFLRYEFELAEKVLNFKAKPPTVKTQLDEVFEIHNDDLKEDEKDKFQEGIDEFVSGDDADALQGFVEEFEEVLSSKKGLIKKVTREIEKRRNPSDFEDLGFAVLHECFSMIEEQSENLNIKDAKFLLEIKNTKLPENIVKILSVYLKNIEKSIPFVKFVELSMPQLDDNAKENDVVFELTMQVDNDNVTKRKFKVLSFQQLELFNFITEVEKGVLPYFENYDGSDIQISDIKEKVKEDVKLYVSSNEPNIEENYHIFDKFANEYISLLQDAIINGISSIDVNELESSVESLLSNIYTSVSVGKHIYHNMNYIGVSDTYPVKHGEIGVPTERIVTIFHPLRLLSYLKRLEHISDQILEWLNRSSEGLLEVEKLEEYLEYIDSKTRDLAPRYFSSIGDDSYLIEVDEINGEGKFSLSTSVVENMDYLSKEFSTELVKVVKNYFDVYPYAKDGLDLLLLYCNSSELITKAIDSLFKQTKIQKLNITVHSDVAAKLHATLNKWIEQREEYLIPLAGEKFPKVEINVISGRNISEIEAQCGRHMSDADIVVLADYFGHSNQVKYTLERIRAHTSNNWFETVYKEPLKSDEDVKRISYISEHLPKTLQYFYQMQYMLHSNIMPEEDEINVLRNIISITNITDRNLIDFMHKRFNWTMIMDRYLDKTLLQKTSSLAQIIQYKSKAGSNKAYKLIVSSSKYIRKLNEKTNDSAYYDRLYKKLESILLNSNISRDKVIDAVQSVKDISGAVVLKVIGRGKYAHEMMATYFTTKTRQSENENALQVWSVCDELPWFTGNQRRPDLVLTTISKQNGQLNVSFELIELKFINHNIFDKERFDAIKQVKSGITLYNNQFNFSENKTDSEFWKEELIHYFIERNSYSPEHANLLKEFQHTPVDEVSVDISGSIDVYCYTSNLTEYQFPKKLENGVYLEELENGFNNYIYNRSFILNELGGEEEVVPDYDEVLEDNTIKNIFEEKIKPTEKIDNPSDENEGQTENQYLEKNEKDDIDKKEAQQEEEPKHLTETQDNNGVSDDDNDNQGEQSSPVYPEDIALKDLDLHYKDNDEDAVLLKNDYERKLIRNFNNIGTAVQIKEAVIGSSVIRLYLKVPSEVPYKKIEARVKDIQIWLGLNEPPIIDIDSNGIFIDIIRPEPDIIYFEQFLKIVRDQLKDKIKEDNLVAPLGLNPLNEVVSLDLSDSTTPHLLVGGTTGSGKSVTLNSIILGIMCLYSSEDVKFVFIDPKQVEFNFYERNKFTQKVITDIESAVLELEVLVEEMERRYSIMNKQYVKDMSSYNKLSDNEKMERIVIVFDEFADFMTQDKETAKRVENSIQRLGQKARAAGIHLIICTQNPKAEVINTKIRSNLPARLALKATDAVASNIILDKDGAEKLAGKGDFLAKFGSSPIRGKSPFLTDEVTRALMMYFEK